MSERIKYISNGAEYSKCGKYRYALWRVWDENLPLIQFIGLNPSTANATSDDPTIKSIVRISYNNGYGGVFMTNLFAFISTDPSLLKHNKEIIGEDNNFWLHHISTKCKEIVFAWGNFNVHGRDKELLSVFTNAKCLGVNKNGSPKHPLYQKANIKLVDYSTHVQ